LTDTDKHGPWNKAAERYEDGWGTHSCPEDCEPQPSKPELYPITVARLTPGDVGSRVVIVSDGVAVDGVLQSFNVTNSTWEKENPIKVSMAVKREPAVLNLSSLPLDYKFQIEREE
jgi:hypothetical protein